jgi:hypothetical protein
MKKYKCLWVLIAIALVTLLTASTGCIKIVLPDETAGPPNQTSQPSGASPDQTTHPSGFLTHTDATNGFSISYPQNWQQMPPEAMAQDAVLGLGLPGATRAVFYVFKSQPTPGGTIQTAYAEMKQVNEAEPGYQFISKDDIIVSGIPAFKYVFQANPGGIPATLVYVYLLQGGVEWFIQLSCAPAESYTQFQPTFDTIIDSFQIFNR